jgi:hypothetical protein
MKAGELHGVQALGPEIARHVLPRFIVPPLSERDPTQPQLIITEDAPDISIALTRHWRGYALIDLTYLIDECGRAQIGTWLPKLFRRARNAGGLPVPTALLSDLGEIEIDAFAAAIDRAAALKFAICIPFDEIDSTECQAKVVAALGRLNLSTEECAVIADFGLAEVSEPRLMAPIILGSLEALQDIGNWQHVIFQGAHFPDKNPADPGGSHAIPRNDWKAWLLAVGADPQMIKQLLFGDYGADCAKIVFGGKGGKAIPHYRYATPNDCIVERGAKTGTHKENMRSVATRLVNSAHFAGAGFSSGDDLILKTSRGGAPGNATTWRQVNTTHHITRTVRDVAALLSIEFVERVTEPEDEQLLML